MIRYISFLTGCVLFLAACTGSENKQVQQAIVEVAPGKYFNMKAPMASKDNKYIQEVKLNGQLLNRSYITPEEIMSGGMIEFTMGAKPNLVLFQ